MKGANFKSSQNSGVRIQHKYGFEFEFHSEFCLLSSEFLQNASFAIGSGMSNSSFAEMLKKCYINSLIRGKKREWKAGGNKWIHQ